MSITRTILVIRPISEHWELRTVLLTYPPDVSALLRDHPVAATSYVVHGHVGPQWGDWDVVEKYSTGPA